MNKSKRAFSSLLRKLTKRNERLLLRKLEEEKKTWKERLIIPPEAKWKSVFDIFILILVGYSCIINIMLVSFIDIPRPSLVHFNNAFVEVLFYLDFVL